MGPEGLGIQRGDVVRASHGLLDDASAMDILWWIYPASSPPAKLRVVADRPLTDKAVRFEVIDEVDAYYRAATSDLDVAIPRRRPPEPRVIAATFAEVPVRIGTAWAVELTISLATASDWRGGKVHADDGGQARRVATLAAGTTNSAARGLSSAMKALNC